MRYRIMKTDYIYLKKFSIIFEIKNNSQLSSLFDLNLFIFIKKFFYKIISDYILGLLFSIKNLCKCCLNLSLLSLKYFNN